MTDPTIAPVDPLKLYELYWVSGGASGTVHVWAPDAQTAIRTVQEHASMFGLREHPIVGHPTELELREQALGVFDGADAA